MTGDLSPNPDGGTMSASRPIDPIQYARRWKTLGVLSLSLVIIGLDNTILNVALPTLQHEFDASPSKLQWMVDSYLLVFAGCCSCSVCSAIASGASVRSRRASRSSGWPASAPSSQTRPIRSSRCVRRWVWGRR